MSSLLYCPVPSLVRSKVRRIHFNNKGRPEVFDQEKESKPERVEPDYVRHRKVLSMRAAIEGVDPIRDLFFLPLIEEG